MANMTDPKIFENITKPMKYRASYVKRDFTVRWLNWDNSVLKTETVGIYMSATPPATPTKPGGTFTGWSKAYDNIQSDTDIIAQYSVKTYTVRWLNWNDTIIRQDTVEHGQPATPPTPPNRPDYTFDRWDKSYSSITSNTDIKALYTANTVTHTVTLKARLYGSVTGGSVQTISTIQVEDGKTPTLPTAPSYTGYNFLEWQGRTTPITADCDVFAIYMTDAAPTIYQVRSGYAVNDSDVLKSSSLVRHAAERNTSSVHSGELDWLVAVVKLNNYNTGNGSGYHYSFFIDVSVSGCGGTVDSDSYGNIKFKFTSTGSATIRVTNKLSKKSTSITLSITAPVVVFDPPSDKNTYQATVSFWVRGNIPPSARVESSDVYRLTDVYQAERPTITGTSSNTSIFLNGQMFGTNSIKFDRVSGATGSATITTRYSTELVSAVTNTWTVSTVN